MDSRNKSASGTLLLLRASRRNAFHESLIPCMSRMCVSGRNENAKQLMYDNARSAIVRGRDTAQCPSDSSNAAYALVALKCAACKLFRHKFQIRQTIFRECCGVKTSTARFRQSSAILTWMNTRKPSIQCQVRTRCLRIHLIAAPALLAPSCDSHLLCLFEL